MSLLINVIGWIGSFAVIAAYGLNSYQIIKSDSWSFQLLNLTGGVFLIIYTFYHNAFANTFINAVWVLIAIGAIIKLLKHTVAKQ